MSNKTQRRHFQPRPSFHEPVLKVGDILTPKADPDKAIEENPVLSGFLKRFGNIQSGLRRLAYRAYNVGIVDAAASIGERFTLTPKEPEVLPDAGRSLTDEEIANLGGDYVESFDPGDGQPLSELERAGESDDA